MEAVSFAPDFDVLAHPAARLVPLPPAKYRLLFGGRDSPEPPPPGRPSPPPVRRVTAMDPAEVAGVRRLAAAVLVTAARELNDHRPERREDARAFVFDVGRVEDLRFWTDLAALDGLRTVEQFRERCWRVVRTMSRTPARPVRPSAAATPTAGGSAARARPPSVASRRRLG